MQKLLEQENSAALICGNPHVPKSEDQTIRIRNSNLYYLAGTLNQDTGVLITPKSVSVFSWRKVDPVWDSEGESLKEIAKRVGGKLVEKESLLDVLKGFDSLYTDFQLGGFAEEFLNRMLKLSMPQFVRKTRSIKPLGLIMARLREVKDQVEINAIKTACKVTSAIFNEFSEIISPGMSELAMTSILLSLLYKHGCEPSFNPIIAAGESAVVLHHSPSNKIWRRGEPLLVDFGVMLNQYCSDMTRVLVDPKNLKAAQLHQIVQDAKEELIQFIRPGLIFKQVQEKAKKLLSKGLKRLRISGEINSLFPHGWGHSIGLDVHDPSLVRIYENYPLKPNMVFTVEPGLYFRGNIKLGFRCEDTVVITTRGCYSLA